MSHHASSPVIFMDSHPEEQDGYFKSWLTSLRTNLTIAATGKVERFQQPGELRLKWFTHDGNTGFKDYDLKEYEQVRKDFHEVLRLPDVHRAVILGFPTQNPYILIDGKNPWVDRYEREKKLAAKLKPEKPSYQAKVAIKGEGILDIETLLRETELAEAERIQQELEEARKKIELTTNRKTIDEEEGLLTGHIQ